MAVGSVGDPLGAASASSAEVAPRVFRFRGVFGGETGLLELKVISLLGSSEALLLCRTGAVAFFVTRGRRGGVDSWRGGDEGRPCCFCLSFWPRVLMVKIEDGNDAFGGREIRKISEAGGGQMELNGIEKLGRTDQNTRQRYDAFKTALVDEMLLLFRDVWLCFRGKAVACFVFVVVVMVVAEKNTESEFGCCDDSCAPFPTGTRYGC